MSHRPLAPVTEASASPASLAPSTTEKEMQVYVYVQVKGVGDIDTVKQTCWLNFYMKAWCKLRGNSYDRDAVCKALNGESVEEAARLRRECDPQLDIMNAKDVHIMDKLWEVPEFPPADDLVACRFECRGTFFQHMHLESFPFDVQKLVITIGTKSPSWEVHPFGEHPKMQGKQSKLRAEYAISPTFDIKDHIEAVSCHAWEGDVNQVGPREGEGRAYNRMEIRLTAERFFQPYIWEVFFPVCFLTSATLTTYLAILKPEDRLEVTVTVLLVIVGYKTYISQCLLPRLSFLTKCDSYVLLSEVTLFFYIMQHVAASNDESWDLPSAGFISVCWATYNVFVLVSICREVFLKPRGLAPEMLALY